MGFEAIKQEVYARLSQIFSSEEDRFELIDERWDERHLFLEVVSERFEGQSRIDRSRLINDMFEDLLAQDVIHALRMRLKTPKELRIA